MYKMQVFKVSARLFAGVLLVGVMVLGLVPTAVHALPSYITVEGTVTKNGKPTPGVEVRAQCYASFFYVFTDIKPTDSKGHYVGHATTVDCPPGAHINVVAYSGIQIMGVVKDRLYPDNVIN